MRQLLIRVPQGRGQDVTRIGQQNQATNMSQWQVIDNGQPQDLIMMHVDNRRVERVLKALEDVPDVHISMSGHETMALHPPPSETPDQVTNVTARSPIEIFMAGLQSVGSWTGFSAYAITAGIIVWIGLFTNRSYLLVAAMLIAPLAGPAMNVALATARGDSYLLKRGMLRYFAALLMIIATSTLLSLAIRLDIISDLMGSVVQISTAAVLLPLSAGVAAALNLSQSENNSLVSTAASGMVVAASLAPPAGVVGMAIVLQRWDLVGTGLFILLLQLVGINLTGAITLRLFGLSARGARYDRGTKWLFPVVLAVTVLLTGGLLVRQLANPPAFQHLTRTREAMILVQRIIEQSDLVEMLEMNLRFTSTEVEGRPVLLGTLYVGRRPGVTLSQEEISQTLSQAIEQALLAEGFQVAPFMDVTVLDTPAWDNSP